MDELSSRAEGHLKTCLQFIEKKPMTGSLSVYDGNVCLEFLPMSINVKDKSGTGSEPFPGELLRPFKVKQILPNEISALLTEYYNNAYNYNFVSLADIHTSNSGSIPVLPSVDIHGRIKIGDEIFGATFAKRHTKSAKILAKFILDDNTTDTYPGLVQYYFKHIIYLPEGPVEHVLAFVRWYKSVDNPNTRFHCQVDNICNVELWNRDFYNLGRDCIIPIHNILGRFISGTVKVGKKNPREYMSVIPLNRKFHI